jgi:hypothetical protein
MPERQALLFPADRLKRRVLFAVELIDPVSQSVVRDDVGITATGLIGAPVVSYSGRFVWREEGESWPERISVTVAGPFLPQVVPAPPRPTDLVNAGAGERLLRIALRPTPAYAFDAGITAVRGRVVEGLEETSPPVTGALVQLAWRDDESNSWRPEPPVSMGGPDASPAEAETDENGEFAVFLRLAPRPPERPDVEAGLLRARLQITRDEAGVTTRATPDTFEFVLGSPTGRLPEAQPLARDLVVAWTELILISS